MYNKIILYAYIILSNISLHNIAWVAKLFWSQSTKNILHL